MKMGTLKKLKVFSIILAFFLYTLYPGVWRVPTVRAQGLNVRIITPQTGKSAKAVEYSITGGSANNGKFQVNCGSNQYSRDLTGSELSGVPTVQFSSIPDLEKALEKQNNKAYNCTVTISLNDNSVSDFVSGITIDQQSPVISSLLLRDSQDRINPSQITTNKIDLLFTFTDNVADSTKVIYAYKVDGEERVRPEEKKSISTLPSEMVLGTSYYVIRNIEFTDVNGDHSFTLSLKDEAGNESLPGSKTVYLNTTPSALISFPTTPTAKNVNITFSEDLSSALLEMIDSSTGKVYGSLALTGEELKAAPQTIALSRISVSPQGKSILIRATLKDFSGNEGVSISPESRILDLVSPQATENIIKFKNSYDAILPPTLGTAVTTENKLDLYIEKDALADNLTATANLKISFSNDGINFGSVSDTNGEVSGAPRELSSFTSETVAGKEYYKVSSWYLPATYGSYFVWARVYDEAGNAITFKNGPIRYEKRISEMASYDYSGGEDLKNLEILSGLKIMSGKIKSGQPTKMIGLRYSQKPDGLGSLPAGLTPLPKYFEVYFTPQDAVEFPLTLRIYFTQAELDAIGATIEKIVGLGYLGSDNQWHLYSGSGETHKVIKPSDLAGFAGYIESTITHLTPLAILADVTPPAKPTTLNVSVEGTTAKISWQPVSEAVKYLLKLTLTDDGTVVTLETTETSVTLTGLEAGKSYIISLEAIDKYGNRSEAFVSPSFNIPKPTTTVSPTPTTVSPKPPVASPAPTKKAAGLVGVTKAQEAQPTITVSPAPTPTPTITPTPQVTPEITPSPEVTEETAAKDRTPWIVLGILILLAAAATAGYFYWFKEEESLPVKKTEEKTEKKKGDEKKPRW